MINCWKHSNENVRLIRVAYILNHTPKILIMTVFRIKTVTNLQQRLQRRNISSLQVCSQQMQRKLISFCYTVWRCVNTDWTIIRDSTSFYANKFYGTDDIGLLSRKQQKKNINEILLFSSFNAHYLIKLLLKGSYTFIIILFSFICKIKRPIVFSENIYDCSRWRWKR